MLAEISFFNGGCFMDQRQARTYGNGNGENRSYGYDRNNRTDRYPNGGDYNKKHSPIRISPIMHLNQMAKYMRVEPNELFEFLRANSTFPYAVIGKRIVFHREAVEAWLKDTTKNPRLANDAKVEDFILDPARSAYNAAPYEGHHDE